MIYGKIVRCAVLILLASLLPACALAAKYPRPVDIPDSQVLKVSADQCSDGIADEDSGDTEYGERALLERQADAERKHNFRLARRLLASRRGLVRRCQASFDSLTSACYTYQFSIQCGTIVYDFYAAQDASNEDTMHRIVLDLMGTGARHGSVGIVEANYQKAWTTLRKTYPLIKDKDASFFPISQRMVNYRAVEASLRAAKKVVDSLPKSARGDFAAGIEHIVWNLDEATE